MQKTKKPNTAKQENQNKETSQQTFNTQLNFLMENELNAIGKLPPDLADRAMKILEKSLEDRKDTDNKILELERQNLNIKEKDVKAYHFWNGFGMVSFVGITCVFAGAGIYLITNKYDVAGYFSFAVGVLTLLPRIIDSFKKKT